MELFISQESHSGSLDMSKTLLVGTGICLLRQVPEAVCMQVYGPQQFPEKLIPKFLLLASQKRELPMHGSGIVPPVSQNPEPLYI